MLCMHAFICYICIDDGRYPATVILLFSLTCISYMTIYDQTIEDVIIPATDVEKLSMHAEVMRKYISTVTKSAGAPTFQLSSFSCTLMHAIKHIASHRNMILMVLAS